jgi:hypothetical protein
VFGANCHRYACFPLSGAELEHFESILDVTLPQAYRTHLIETGVGAGPYYGLFSPKQVYDELTSDEEEYIKDFGSAPTPKSDFPFTQADASRIRQSVLAGESEPWGEAPYPSPGAIPIAHQGCTFWTMLVTSGELYGTVWDVACYQGYDGLWLPARRPTAVLSSKADSRELHPLPDILTFDAWFDGWLEAALLDLAGVERLKWLSKDNWFGSTKG